VGRRTTDQGSKGGKKSPPTKPPPPKTLLGLFELKKGGKKSAGHSEASSTCNKRGGKTRSASRGEAVSEPAALRAGKTVYTPRVVEKRN